MQFDYEEIYDLEYRSTEDHKMSAFDRRKKRCGTVLEQVANRAIYNRFKNQFNGDYTGIDLDAAALRRLGKSFLE